MGEFYVLTVTCVYVQGEYPYTPDYVTRLREMVARWIDRPFRFCCLTDQPWLFKAPVESIPILKLPGFAPWTKLQLFHPERNWTGRMLYLDLDTLIVAPLQPIIDYPQTFAITADPPRPGQKAKDSYGRQIVRRFNSSVIVWDGGTHTDLYTQLTLGVSNRLSGDQDWIGEQLPHAATMPRSWFPRISEAIRPPWQPDVKVILRKVPKNAILAEENPWFAPLWGAA